MSLHDELLKLGGLGNAFVHAVIPFVSELNEGQFVQGTSRIWTYRPANFIALDVHPRARNVTVSLTGFPSDFEQTEGLSWKEGFPYDYSRAKVNSILHFDCLLKCIRKSHSNFMSRPKRRKAALRNHALIAEVSERLADVWLNEKLPMDVMNYRTGEILILANKKVIPSMLLKIAEAHDEIDIESGLVRDEIFRIITDSKKKFPSSSV